MSARGWWSSGAIAPCVGPLQTAVGELQRRLAPGAAIPCEASRHDRTPQSPSPASRKAHSGSAAPSGRSSPRSPWTPPPARYRCGARRLRGRPDRQSTHRTVPAGRTDDLGHLDGPARGGGPGRGHGWPRRRRFRGLRHRRARKRPVGRGGLGGRPVGVKGIGEVGNVVPRRRSPTRSGTRPASAAGRSRSGPTAF